TSAAASITICRSSTGPFSADACCQPTRAAAAKPATMSAARRRSRRSTNGLANRKTDKKRVPRRLRQDAGAGGWSGAGGLSPAPAADIGRDARAGRLAHHRAEGGYRAGRPFGLHDQQRTAGEIALGHQQEARFAGE